VPRVLAFRKTNNKSLISCNAIDMQSSLKSHISMRKSYFCSKLKTFAPMSFALKPIPTDSEISAPRTSVRWFCLQTQPKHEHLAAAHLRKMDNVEVFLPRIRFQRATRQAHTWVTEALFPGYLFARFNWDDRLRQVQAARGVRNIVHFGDFWPALPATTIAQLRELVGATELHTIAHEFSPGDPVLLTQGGMRGLRGLISRVLPGQKRVEVLMEILGRQTSIELEIDSLVREGCERAGLFRR